MMRGRVFFGAMLGGAAISAVALCVVIILIVQEFRQITEFSIMVAMAYLMICGAAIFTILALSAFIGGIAMLFVPKEKRTQPHAGQVSSEAAPSAAPNEPAA